MNEVEQEVAAAMVEEERQAGSGVGDIGEVLVGADAEVDRTRRGMPRKVAGDSGERVFIGDEIVGRRPRLVGREILDDAAEGLGPRASCEQGTCEAREEVAAGRCRLTR